MVVTVTAGISKGKGTDDTAIGWPSLYLHGHLEGATHSDGRVSPFCNPRVSLLGHSKSCQVDKLAIAVDTVAFHVTKLALQQTQWPSISLIWYL